MPKNDSHLQFCNYYKHLEVSASIASNLKKTGKG